MAARVGLLTLELSVPGADSLKKKRARIRPLIDGIRNRFMVSIAEVGMNDIHDRAEIGVAAVSNNAATVEKVLADVASFAEKFDVRIDSVGTEVM